MFRTKPLFIFAVAFAISIDAPSAHAGDGGGYGAGNGGTGVICKDPKTGRETLSLLDLWQFSRTDIQGPRLVVRESQESVETLVAETINKVVPYGWKEGAAFRLSLQDEAAHVIYSLLNPANYLDKDSLIEFPPEKLPASRPKKCRYAPIVSYQSDGSLLVDPVLLEWLKKDPVQYAALIVHETFYRIARDLYGVQDSEFIRELVAYLFSDGHPDPNHLVDLKTKFTRSTSSMGPATLRLNHHWQKSSDDWNDQRSLRFEIFAWTDHARRNQCLVDVRSVDRFGNLSSVTGPMAVNNGVGFEAVASSAMYDATIDFSSIGYRSRCRDEQGESYRCKRAEAHLDFLANDGIQELKKGQTSFRILFRCDSPAKAFLRIPHREVPIPLFRGEIEQININESVLIQSSDQPQLIQIR